jgi:hypothetical protein
MSERKGARRSKVGHSLNSGEIMKSGQNSPCPSSPAAALSMLPTNAGTSTMVTWVWARSQSAPASPLTKIHGVGRVASIPAVTPGNVPTAPPPPSCIPTRGTKVPARPDWFHEIKHDGYRLIVQREGKRVRLLTRNGYDWSDRYPLNRRSRAKTAQNFPLFAGRKASRVRASTALRTFEFERDVEFGAVGFNPALGV